MPPMAAMPAGGVFPGMAQPHPFWSHPTAPLHPSPGMLPQRFAPHPMPYSIEVRLPQGISISKLCPYSNADLSPRCGSLTILLKFLIVHHEQGLKTRKVPVGWHAPPSPGSGKVWRARSRSGSSAIWSYRFDDASLKSMAAIPTSSRSKVDTSLS